MSLDLTGRRGNLPGEIPTQCCRLNALAPPVPGLGVRVRVCLLKSQCFEECFSLSPVPSGIQEWTQNSMVLGGGRELI